MEFNLPTTLEEMYVVLNDLFFHYRVQRLPFEEPVLQPLVIERMEYTPLTDEQILSKAKDMLYPAQEREIMAYAKEIEEKIAELTQKIALAQIDAEKEKDEVISLFSNSVQKVEEQAVKAGLINSNVVVVQTAKLESDKNESIAKINSYMNEKIAEYTAQKSVLLERLSSTPNYFRVVHQYDLKKKVEELKDEREKMSIEVFKYNNSLDEKEQRYANSLIQSRIRLRINYMEVATRDLTKDQLIELGYYADVIECVSGYFDTLEPADAYYKFKENAKLAVYLDDFYEDMLYLYKINSGI